MRTCLHTSYTLLSEKFSSLKNVLIWQIWGMSASLETNLNHLCCDSRLPCYVFCTLTNRYKLKQKSTFHLLTRQQMQGWEKISLKTGHFGISPARNYCWKLKTKERHKDNFFTAIFTTLVTSQVPQQQLVERKQNFSLPPCLFWRLPQLHPNVISSQIAFRTRRQESWSRVNNRLFHERNLPSCREFLYKLKTSNYLSCLKFGNYFDKPWRRSIKVHNEFCQK